MITFSSSPIELRETKYHISRKNVGISSSDYISQGGDLRQVGPTMRGPRPAADRAELPRHRHPQGNEPGGETLKVYLVLNVYIVLWKYMMLIPIDPSDPSEAKFSLLIHKSSRANRTNYNYTLKLLYQNYISRYQQFKDFQKRILVATNLFGRGMDIERVNIVFNYDMPEDTDTYLHRVARAGRCVLI